MKVRDLANPKKLLDADVIDCCFAVVLILTIIVAVRILLIMAI